MVLFSFPVTEGKAYKKMESLLAVSHPNSEMKYEQKSKIKDSVLQTLIFEIKRYLYSIQMQT